MVTEQTSNDLDAGDIHIWRIDLAEHAADASQLLSADELERAQAIRSARERDRFIRARTAMRSILGDYLGISGSNLCFIQKEKGKPSLDYPGSYIEFNLSHCEDMALLAVTRHIPVGIDLEMIRARKSQLKIARRMFQEPIYKELQNMSPEQLATAFTRHWTELEARAKCEGNGIFSPVEGRSDITSSHFYPENGWVACVATKGADISTLELKHFLYRY